MIPWTNEIITKLQPDEVFVFGSNEQGFHGAGAAGLAFRGDARNTWRNDPKFLEAMKSSVGHPSRVGKWAIFGQATGLQIGLEGKSFAVITIERPGLKRSYSRRSIYYQLLELWDLTRSRPDWNFLISPLGEGYAGYSPAEMNEVWEFLIAKHSLPPNVRFIGRVNSPTNPTRTSVEWT